MFRQIAVPTSCSTQCQNCYRDVNWESVLEVYNSLYDTVNYQVSTGVYCRISLCSKSDNHTPVFESKRKKSQNF